MPVGADALDAQRRRNVQLDNCELKRLSGTVPAQSPAAATIIGKTPLVTASQQYFLNLEARGADPKTIRTYRTAVEQFLGNCTATYVYVVSNFVIENLACDDVPKHRDPVPPSNPRFNNVVHVERYSRR
jgi:hypothetical protein